MSETPPTEHDTGINLDEPWVTVEAALESGDRARLTAIFEELTLSDGLRALLQLDEEQREQVLTLIPPELAAELISEAPTEQAAELVESLDAKDAAEIVEELDSDVQADVVGELEEEDAQAILAEMAPEDAAEVRRLVEYDDDTAGGLMIGETFSFSHTDTVGAVLTRVTQPDEDFERYRGQHPYIVDSAGRLVGVVSLRNLLTARKSTPLTEIMVTPMSVRTDTALGELQDILDEEEYLGLPVVDEAGKLVGTVSRSAVADALLESVPKPRA